MYTSAPPCDASTRRSGESCAHRNNVPVSYSMASGFPKVPTKPSSHPNTRAECGSKARQRSCNGSKNKDKGERRGHRTGLQSLHLTVEWKAFPTLTHTSFPKRLNLFVIIPLRDRFLILINKLGIYLITYQTTLWHVQKQIKASAGSTPVPLTVGSFAATVTVKLTPNCLATVNAGAKAKHKNWPKPIVMS